MKKQHVQQEQEVKALQPWTVMQAIAQGMLKLELCPTKIQIIGNDLCVEIMTKKGAVGASCDINVDTKKFMKEMIIKGLDAEKDVILFVIGRLVMGLQLTQATAIFCVISDHLKAGEISQKFAIPFEFTTWSDQLSKEDAQKLEFQN